MPRRSRECLIELGDTSSASVDIGSSHWIGLRAPASLVATSLTVAVSDDDSTFATAKYHGGTDVTLTIAASQRIGFTQVIKEALEPWRYVKLNFTPAEAADRTFYILTES